MNNGKEILMAKREALWQQKRKKENLSKFSQHRKKFLDMSQLLIMTQKLQNNLHNQESKRNDIGSQPKFQLLNQKAVDWNKLSLCSNLILKEKYFQEYLKIIVYGEFQTNMLEILHNFIVKIPEVQISNFKNLQILQKILNNLTNYYLNQANLILVLECINKFTNEQHLRFISKSKKLIEVLLYYLKWIEREDIFNKILVILCQIFTDQNSDDNINNLVINKSVILQNLDFFKILQKCLQTRNQKIVQIILDTITNIVLSGQEMLQLFFQFNFVVAITNIFQSCGINIKQKILTALYNMMIVANQMQIIYLCQQNVLAITMYCLQNQLSLNSVQLSLKMLSKIIRIANSLEQNMPGFLAYVDNYLYDVCNIQRKLFQNLQNSDQFVREQSSKLLQLIAKKIKGKMEQQQAD